MTAMRLKRYPSPSGGFALGKMGVGATMLKHGKTARDYVQSGLVAMWDGIENAGWGTHNPSATAWADLTGNEGSVPAVGTPKWTDNAFDGSRDDNSAVGVYFKSSSNNLGEIIQTGTYSIEIAVTPGTTIQSNGGIVGIGSSRQFWIWEANNVRDYFIDAIQSSQGAWDRPTDNSRDKSYVYQFSLNNGTGLFLVNGTLMQTKSYSTASKTSDGFCIGWIDVYNTTRSQIHSIRMYSRALTAAEIAANYAIDKERFNLP